VSRGGGVGESLYVLSGFIVCWVRLFLNGDVSSIWRFEVCRPVPRVGSVPSRVSGPGPLALGVDHRRRTGNPSRYGNSCPVLRSCLACGVLFSVPFRGGLLVFLRRVLLVVSFRGQGCRPVRAGRVGPFANFFPISKISNSTCPFNPSIYSSFHRRDVPIVKRSPPPFVWLSTVWRWRA